MGGGRIETAPTIGLLFSDSPPQHFGVRGTKVLARNEGVTLSKTEIDMMELNIRSFASEIKYEAV